MIIPSMILPPLRFSALLRDSAFTPCFLLRRGSAALRAFARFCHTLFVNVFLPPSSYQNRARTTANRVQSRSIALNLAQKNM